MPIARKTKYFEVDEKLNYHCNCLCDKEDLKNSSYSKTSSDASPITELWNVSDDERQVIIFYISISLFDYFNCKKF